VTEIVDPLATSSSTSSQDDLVVDELDQLAQCVFSQCHLRLAAFMVARRVRSRPQLIDGGELRALLCPLVGRLRKMLLLTFLTSTRKASVGPPSGAASNWSMCRRGAVELLVELATTVPLPTS